MMKVIVFPDLQARAIMYLRGVFGGPGGTPMPTAINDYLPFATVLPEVPEGWAWDDLLIVVADAGGGGMTDWVLDDARLSVDVSHPSQEVASEAARRVYAALIGWQRVEPGVYYRGTIQRPTWWPDDETRQHVYTQTLRFAQRGEETTF